jgi:NAD+ synthase (glutamine-hydrolysing)
VSDKTNQETHTMEIRNELTNMVMEPELRTALEAVRGYRGFNVERVVEAKVQLLNQYYRQAGLKSAVVAVSGGLDSAVVLGLVELASRADNSPIERIVAVTMPALHNDGVTGQADAAELAHKVCRSFNVEPLTIRMDGIVDALTQGVENALGEPLESKARWCRGQVVSYARTPTYYYVTSVLAAQGQPGLIIGTTNLSEGGYLGYFGKASDGMVDVQLISDLYKSEVYKVAEFLGVPEEVLTRAPTGDMFDATTDEVVFGAPYDFVELYMEFMRGHQRQMRDDANDYRIYAIQKTLGGGERNAATAQWEEYAANLERMHAYNAHKYLGRSPAVHLDVLDCGVSGGWNNPAWSAK